VKKRTVSSGVWSATVLESYRKAKGWLEAARRRVTNGRLIPCEIEQAGAS
jgi:hypothetical protein